MIIKTYPIKSRKKVRIKNMNKKNHEPSHHLRATNWKYYIEDCIKTGLESRTPYKIIPYKNGIGIKKIEFINPKVPYIYPLPLGVKVGLIDTGINYTLPEITSKISRVSPTKINGYDFVENDNLPYDIDFVSSPFFPRYHGTSVASIIIKEAPKGLHTLYISPLKALANDIERNLEFPIKEMELDITLETRTGDTKQSKRTSQKLNPPNFLMTTPESFILMLSWETSKKFFGNLKFLIIDEIHTLFNDKRGDLLSLGISELRNINSHFKKLDNNFMRQHVNPLSKNFNEINTLRSIASQSKIKTNYPQENM